MNAETIVRRADELGIQLTTDGDKISYAPKSITPDAFVETLREHKAEVMAYLERQADLLDWASHLAEQEITLREPVEYVEAVRRTVKTTRASWYASHYVGTISYARLQQDNDGWGQWDRRWWLERERDAFLALENLKQALEEKEAPAA